MPLDYLWEGGPVLSQSKNFRYGTDSILLGNFAPVNGVKKAADLGCASGVITLLLLWRSETIHVTGIELNTSAAALAEDNIALNRCSGRCSP